MPWKTDESGAFVKDDKGNPIFVQDGGEEKSVDFPAMSSALTKANRLLSAASTADLSVKSIFPW